MVQFSSGTTIISGGINITDTIFRELEGIGCTVKACEPMRLHTSFKIGGPADYFVSVSTVEQLQSLIHYVKANSFPLRVIGNGSNLLVSDGGLRGIVAKLEGEFAKACIDDEGLLVCGAGMTLSAACNCALENSLTGMEFAFGIPGTVGGAVFMNAGAYGGEIKDIFAYAECLSLDGSEIVRLSREECCFDYRHSVFMHNNMIILKAALRLEAVDDRQEIRRRMDETYGKRRDKQPLEYPSAGSVFKRPEGHFAGALIQESGLKGAQIGGAQVSEKHAGFIINKGNATCRDVLDLISHVQKTVMENSGVELECEIKAIGTE